MTAIDDLIVESDETVSLQLTKVIADPEISVDAFASTAALTILDNDSAKISIATTQDGNETGPVSGKFTITQSAPSSTDTVVTYSVSGTAIPFADYLPLSGTVTIPAGQTTTAITVGSVDDFIVEADETVSVQLTSVTFADPEISVDASSSSASLTILDNDSGKISIATTQDGNETGPVSGQFTITQSDPSSTDTVVTYSVSGSAIPFADYLPLTGTVTIPAGQTTVAITVGSVDDFIVEADETVNVQLTSVTFGDPEISVDASSSSASLTILDNDSGKISIATTQDGNETGPVSGKFTITQSAPSSTDTVVTYSVSGTANPLADYLPLTGTVTIPAGQTTVAITVGSVDDFIVEADETVNVQLTSVTFGDPEISVDAFANKAALTIFDNDAAKVSMIKLNDLSEGSPLLGTVLVAQSSPSSTPTVVSYSVSGTASPFVDYLPLTGTVTIPAGQTTAAITVTAIEDLIVETDETVSLQLTKVIGDPEISVDAFANKAALTIFDNDAAKVSIIKLNDLSEGSPLLGTVLVAQSSPSSTPTVVTYSVSGTAIPFADYLPLSGTVTIPAGQTTVAITVGSVDDFIVEADETVNVQLTSVTFSDPEISVDASASSASLTILDNDAAKISIAMTQDGNETGPVSGKFTITQSAPSSTDTVVTYSVSGTANPLADYLPLTGTVTIPAGQTTTAITVGSVEDFIVEADETVSVQLTSVTFGDPEISMDAFANKAALTIFDNDAAKVSMIKLNDLSEGSPLLGTVLVAQSSPSSTPTVVSYSVSGTASPFVDYLPLSGTVTIPAGQTTAAITVTALDDLIVETDEAVSLKLTKVIGDAEISVDASASSASLTILDNDAAKISIAMTQDGNETGPVSGKFTITQSAPSSTDTVVSYSVSGTAIPFADYLPLSGTVTIPAGQTTTAITVTAIDDLIVEFDETVSLQLTKVIGDPQVSMDAFANKAALTIFDNDAAKVSMIKLNDLSEGSPLFGTFVVTQSSASSTPTVVTYSVSGTAIPFADYLPLSGTVTIPAGQTTVAITVGSVDDFIVEADETVNVQLTSVTFGDPEISVDAFASTAALTILDNDSAKISIATTQDGNETGPVSGKFKITKALLVQPTPWSRIACPVRLILLRIIYR